MHHKGGRTPPAVPAPHVPRSQMATPHGRVDAGLPPQTKSIPRDSAPPRAATRPQVRLSAQTRRSETRSPQVATEGNPRRRGARMLLRASDFELLSGFGFRISDF